MEITVH